MEQNKLRHHTLGEIIANDVRTASIFSEFRIDFCVEASKTLEQACKPRGLDITFIENKLVQVQIAPLNQNQNYNKWALDFLCNYIVCNHHNIVLKTLPQLKIYTQTIAEVHGNAHPELMEIESIINCIYADLIKHIDKERQMLFPTIKGAVESSSLERKSILSTEIPKSISEHDFVVSAISRIVELSNCFEAPSDACKTFQNTYELLKKFDSDLKLLIHIENNILFPKSLQIA
jgi:regulator of cell morphogenesis and NO signaling